MKVWDKQFYQSIKNVEIHLEVLEFAGEDLHHPLLEELTHHPEACILLNVLNLENTCQIVHSLAI